MMVLKEVSKMVSNRNGGVDGMGIAHLKRGMWIADSRRYQASSVIGVIKSDG